MTGRRIAYGLVLIGAAAFWIYYDGMVSVYLLALVLALPFFSLLVSLPFVRRPAAEIDAPRTASRGSECAVLFRIRCRGKRARLPGIVRASFSDLMEERRDRLIFDAPEDGILVFEALHSGVWQAEIKKAWLCDFLGLWRFPAAVPPPVRLTVPPVPEEPSPAPDFGLFRTSAVAPMPGGGFSEIHELREYRPGDPMRSVHWKATAKTDQPVVREPQIALFRRALVTLSLPDGKEEDARSEADRTLDRLTWVSGRLLEMDIPHAVFFQTDGTLVEIKVRDDLAAFTEKLLSSPLPGKEDSGEAVPPAADWIFRVNGGRSDAKKEADR